MRESFSLSPNVKVQSMRRKEVSASALEKPKEKNVDAMDARKMFLWFCHLATSSLDSTSLQAPLAGSGYWAAEVVDFLPEMAS